MRCERSAGPMTFASKVNLQSYFGVQRLRSAPRRVNVHLLERIAPWLALIVLAGLLTPPWSRAQDTTVTPSSPTPAPWMRPPASGARSDRFGSGIAHPIPDAPPRPEVLRYAEAAAPAVPLPVAQSPPAPAAQAGRQVSYLSWAEKTALPEAVAPVPHSSSSPSADPQTAAPSPAPIADDTSPQRARLYSVHRDYGLQPDPAPIPPDAFTTSVDLAGQDQSAAQPLPSPNTAAGKTALTAQRLSIASDGSP